MTFDLKSARVNAGHSIRSLAVELDMAPGTIAKLEAGFGARPASAKKVADYFDIRVVDLLPGEVQG